MDWPKLDAGLAAALGDGGRGGADSLTVFIGLEDDAPKSAREILEALGARVDPDQHGCSATLSGEQVSMLSHQPWVRRLSLATSLRLQSDP